LFPLILLLDLFAYGFGHALDGLGANPQVGQRFQVLPPAIKRLSSSYLTHHATSSGTEARTDHVQLSILRDHPLATRRAVVIGSTDLHWTQDRDQSLLSVFYEASRRTPAATKAGALVGPVVRIEQLLQ